MGATLQAGLPPIPPRHRTRSLSEATGDNVYCWRTRYGRPAASGRPRRLGRARGGTHHRRCRVWCSTPHRHSSRTTVRAPDVVTGSASDRRATVRPVSGLCVYLDHGDLSAIADGDAADADELRAAILDCGAWLVVSTAHLIDLADASPETRERWVDAVWSFRFVVFAAEPGDARIVWARDWLRGWLEECEEYFPGWRETRRDDSRWPPPLRRAKRSSSTRA